MFSQTEKDDQLARREAGMKEQKAIGLAAKDLNLLSPESKENAKPLGVCPAGNNNIDPGQLPLPNQRGAVIGTVNNEPPGRWGWELVHQHLNDIAATERALRFYNHR